MWFQMYILVDIYSVFVLVERMKSYKNISRNLRLPRNHIHIVFELAFAIKSNISSIQICIKLN